MEGLPAAWRWGVPCGLCQRNEGAIVRCSTSHCAASFHPLCARNAGLYLAVRGDLGAPRTQYRAYCSMHSEPQRRKDQCAEVHPSPCSMNKTCVFLMSFLQLLFHLH